MIDLRRAALYYAGRFGWAVLPCEPGGKAPLSRHGVRDASRDAATINRWWREHPDANIGLALGQASGVVVLDVDDLEALRDLVAEHGPLPETACSTTGRGQHFLFRCPEGGLRTRNVAPGVQLRGDGSYIVVPPSVHPSGKRYEWELSPDEVPLAELPAWLLKEPERQPLGELPERVYEGQRNELLFRYACKLRGTLGMAEAEILAALRAMNVARCDPPLEDDEVADIAASCCRYPAETNVLISPNGQREAVPAPLRELDATELATLDIATELSSLPLLGQDGYVIEGWSHLVAGYPKAGKTEVVYACVRDWVRVGQAVLWITEESELVWVHRLRRDPGLPRGLRLVFGLGERPDRLLDRAMRGDESIVVIDTVRSLLGITDEADNAEIARVIGQWESALRGKTRVYVHHLRKGLGEHGLAVAGGTMLVGAVDRVLELRHDEHDPNRRILRVLSRIVGARDLLLGLDGEGWPVALGDAAAVEFERVMAACLDVLEPETWLKTSEVRDRLPEPRPSHNQVLKALRELWQQGVIERDPAEDRQRATYRWRLLPGSRADLHFTHIDMSRVKQVQERMGDLSSHGVSPCEVSCPTPSDFTSHGGAIRVGSEVGYRCRCGGTLRPSDRPDWLQCDRCKNYVRARDPALRRQREGAR